MQGLMPRKGEMALDLYCGVGLFAGALADRLGDKGALPHRGGKGAVEDARHNLTAFDPEPHRTGQGRARSSRAPASPRSTSSSSTRLAPAP